MDATSINKLRLEGQLSIRDASALASRLLEAMSAGGEVLVDTTDLTGADIAILQLLVSALKSASEPGRRMSVHAPEAGALRRAIEKSAIGTALGASLVWDGDLWTGVDQAEGDAA